MRRNWFAATFLSILLVSLSAPLFALPASASEDENQDDVRIVPGTWYRLESDIVTVLFPASGGKPMFIWWYTGSPDQIYVVKFKGLIEWFAFNSPMLPRNPDYYNHLRDASQETWMSMYGRMSWLQLMMQWMQTAWHSPFLPFDAVNWTLTQPSNITTPDGKIIGVSFGFTLTDVPAWMPNMQFAENNIMIRVRFYNVTTEETVAGTNPPFKYQVNAGEMKMDLAVNKWVWNSDILKQFVSQLQEAGFNVTIPEVKSRLALWVNLASINMTRLTLNQAEENPDEIEGHSTVTHMEIEDQRVDITENRTTEMERPIEIQRPVIKIGFANETTKLGGFFRFVSSAKITGYPNEGDVNMVPAKAAYIAGGAHMRLFIGYPYFSNGTLEHDPSIGVEDTLGVDTTPKYTVQTPIGLSATPLVLGRYVMPLFTPELMVALIALVSATAIILYVVKWKRKTPVNMVVGGITG